SSRGFSNHELASTTLDRRTVLQLAGSGFVFLLGTQLGCGSGVSDDQRASFAASTACAVADDLAALGLDGAFVFDAAALDPFSKDFGFYVHRKPLGVLKPGSVRDIQKVLEFANRRLVPVVMRGKGHSAYGQTQVQGGIVIDG